jgi:uracil-DNA glycosylase family 4
MSINGIEIDCHRCPTDIKLRRHHVVIGVGNPQASIMLVGEAPGKQEDLQSLPFVGKAGEMLNNLLRDVGMKRSDLFVTNIVKCRPTEGNANRTPTPIEIETCSKYLRMEIDMVNPKKIAPLGNSALQFFKPGASIKKEHGKAFFWEGRVIVPLYHPMVAVYDYKMYPILFEGYSLLRK